MASVIFSKLSQLLDVALGTLRNGTTYALRWNSSTGKFDAVSAAVVNGYTFTGYTGGGATKADSVVTLGLAPGTLFVLGIDTRRIWQLQAGTDATDVNAGIFRGADFNATTNPFVWVSIL